VIVRVYLTRASMNLEREAERESREGEEDEYREGEADREQRGRRRGCEACVKSGDNNLKNQLS